MLLAERSYPVYVCEKLSSLEVPSFISYANPAFVKLSKYSWVRYLSYSRPRDSVGLKLITLVNARRRS